MDINVGDICVCNSGHIGVVTSIYHSGFKKLYKGFHLTETPGKNIGSAWESTAPKKSVSIKQFQDFVDVS